MVSSHRFHVYKIRPNLCSLNGAVSHRHLGTLTNGLTNLQEKGQAKATDKQANEQRTGEKLPYLHQPVYYALLQQSSSVTVSN